MRTDPVWEDDRRTPLPTLQGTAKADICVVGLGGSGLAAVQELLRHSVTVIGLEAKTVAGGAAGRNGGFLLAGTAKFYHRTVAQLGRERASRLYRLTLAQLDAMVAETPQVIRRVGSLRIATSTEEEADCREQLAAMQADGLPVLPYEGPQGRGLLFPSDGAFNPLRRCRLLAEQLVAAGARLFEHTPALTLTGSRVTTPQGEVTCGRVIVAVDGGLERLLPELAGTVRTARLQMLATAPTREVHVPRPVYARWGYEYWQQLEDGRLALGGFRDLGGEAEWTDAAEPSAVVQRALTRFLRRHLGVRAAITHRWAAPVGYTQSGLPMLAEVRPGLWAAGGYNGTGNLMGALCGQAAARLALGEASDLLALLRPS